MLEGLKGKISDDEGRKLMELASKVTRGVIVEVGSHRGKSTCFIAEGSRLGSGAWVYAVDLWMKGKNKHWNSPEIYTYFLEQTQPWADLVIPLMDASLEVARRWVYPIGFLFIDANHSTKAALADYNAWSPFILSGGWMAYDDCNKKKVRRVINLIKATGEWHQFEKVGKVWLAQKV